MPLIDMENIHRYTVEVDGGQLPLSLLVNKFAEKSRQLKTEFEVQMRSRGMVR